MITKMKNNSSLAIQIPQILNSVTSEGSISNYVAQTPKQNLNFKKINNHPQKFQQKQNLLRLANNNIQPQDTSKGRFPYKMVNSEYPSPCLNHPDKQSSFFIESNEGEDIEPIFYCQKCAILVASQGFQVKKIQGYCKEKTLMGAKSVNSTRFLMKDTKTAKKSRMIELTKEQKQNLLTNFLNTLERVQSKIDKNYEDNQMALDEIDSAVLMQEKNIKQIFSNFHQVLDGFEQLQLQQLQNKCLSLRQSFEINSEQLSNDTATLESMKQDICQVYDDIINQTTSSQFQTVMNSYQKNVLSIEDILEEQEQKNYSLFIPKNQTQIESLCEQILNELHLQITSKRDQNRRLSIKNTSKRMGMAGNTVR